MNNKKISTIVLGLLSALSGSIAFAVQNPSTHNPAGYTTTPQSYLSNGLVDTSNPIDYSGNQIVTGNVRRGAHFRGDVPYTSPSSFSSSLGTSTLSSFMRDSTGAEDFGSYRGTTARSASGTNYQPYHLPSSSVTTMSPNNSGLTTQLNTSVNNRQYVSDSQMQQNQPVVPPNTSQGNISGTTNQRPTKWQLYNSGLAGSQSQYNTSKESQRIYTSPRVNEQRLLEQNTNENRWSNPSFSENSTATQQSELPQNNFQQNTGVPGQSLDQINQWQQESTFPGYGTSQSDSPISANQPAMTYTQQQTSTMNESVTRKIQNPPTTYRPGNLEQSLPVNNNTMYQPYNVPQPTGTQQYQEQSQGFRDTTKDMETSQAIAQIQKQLDDLIRSIDSRLQNPTDYTSQYTTTVQDVKIPGQTDTSYQAGISSRDFSDQSNNRRVQELLSSSDGLQTQSSQNKISQPASPSQMSQRQIHEQARRIMAPYTDYESYSQAKYNQIFRAAEGHLNIGRFYQAADAYTLAAIYNPDDPLCYAGRGHALFAAGDYINSALLLIRAIEIDPEYVNTQIDLAELVGSPEDLNKRITELNKWLQKSNAPGLGFLLGYVYYREGNLSKARQVMETVCQEMPHSRASVALKMAIDFKIQTQK